MKKLVNAVLRDKKKYKEIIQLCTEMTSLVFAANAGSLFSETSALETKKCQDLIADFRNKIIALDLCQKEEIDSLSDQSVYNDIIHEISIVLIRKKAFQPH